MRRRGGFKPALDNIPEDNVVAVSTIKCGCPIQRGWRCLLILRPQDCWAPPFINSLVASIRVDVEGQWQRFSAKNLLRQVHSRFA